MGWLELGFYEKSPYEASEMTQLSSECLDLKKTGQLVYFFLKKASERQMHVTKLRLIKWIYLAERESYKEFGEPLINDKLCSLEHGPVPSGTLSIIEGKKENVWKDIFSVARDGSRHQYLQLVNNCVYSSSDDLDRFSDAEVQLVESVWAEYGVWSSKRLETHLHDVSAFPEWNWKQGDKTNWIELETLLSSVGFSDEQIPQIVSNIVAFSSPQANCSGF